VAFQKLIFKTAFARVWYRLTA